MKFIIGNLYTIYLAVNQKQTSQWRVLSAENLRSPLSLPVLMTKGPRWNTHAIIGTLGPFTVKKTLTIDLESANSSSLAWIAVIYSFPDYQTTLSLESGKVNNNDESWETITLEPGKYSIGLRYYHWQEKVVLPAIKIDDRLLVEATTIPNNVNDFYQDLSQRKNWFYLSLHYYIYTILKFRNKLPESFVDGEYLPVGAPDTYFYYNYLAPGQNLEVEVEELVLNNFDLYFTLYNRCSLPISWCAIEKDGQIFSLPDNEGFYLFRVRLKPQAIASKLSMQVKLLTQDSNNQKIRFLSTE